MLKSIHIKNLVIIKSIDIDWTSGLNILTGETGAGKSILFDALSIVLGAKANSSYIRHGADKAVIEAVFQSTPQVSSWLKKQELNDMDDKEVIVAREITKSASRARINGTLVNNNLLKELRALIITFHAQHEIRTLMNNSTQLVLLDGIAEKNHQSLLERYKQEFARYKETEEKLNSIQLSEEERLRRLDFARFQFEELKEASLGDENEDTELSETRKFLDNVQEIENSVVKSIDNLSGGDGNTQSDSSSAIEKIQESLYLIDSLIAYDESLRSAKELLETSLANAEEASQCLRRYSDGIDSDPETLSSIEERLNTLASIKRKYGPSLIDAINQRDELEQEIDRLENASNQANSLKEELDALKTSSVKLAIELSDKRKSIAKSLESSIMLELKDLGMDKAKFKIAFERLAEPSSQGLDRVEFTISTNIGTPEMPLAKIASGGELSRIMLALKTIFARQDKVATVVFDEIDAGMSGKTLHAIREKLARLAKSHQILSITHNPIIASVADNHIQVCKEQSTKETIIRVSNLTAEQRLDSIAQMASGDSGKTESLNFARSLMDAAAQLKGTIK